MRVLLSAYACEPNKGSEPGVGWNWAIELSKLGHEVHVITRANNEEGITAALRETSYDNLYFNYYDVPKWLSCWKKGGRGVRLYYFLWQIGIYAIARALVKKYSFDVVHHVTFVSVRQPSFLGMLGVPFIFGPVAGGERAPMRLRRSFPIKGKFTDSLRDIVNTWVRFSPLMRLTFRSAQRIYVTSEQTRQLLPKKFHKKTFVKLAIASDSPSQLERMATNRIPPPVILYVGQLLYLKGVHLALRSFALLIERLPESKLTILGNGPDKLWLKDLSVELGIEHAVEWLEWMPRNELDGVYQRHDLFLFPSLRDSGGMVVLEAMSNGLPVVCLDLGGPGVTVDDTCGYKVVTKGLAESAVVEDLGGAMIGIFESSKLLHRLVDGALKKNSEASWSKLVETVVSESYRKRERQATGENQ